MFRTTLLSLKLILLLSVPVYATTMMQTSPDVISGLTVAGCIIAWMLGTIGGALYPMPPDSQITSVWLKLTLSSLAGLVALVYTLQDGGGLKSVSIIWVGLVSLIAPSMAENAKSLFISFVNKKLGA